MQSTKEMGVFSVRMIELRQVHQKNAVFYAMVADPREVVRLMKRVKEKEVQEAQRPWSLKKVQEIASFVAGRLKLSDSYQATGLIPNAPILNIMDKLSIHQDRETGRFYLCLPETEEEFRDCQGCLEAIDGQHRLLAFAEDLRDPLFSEDTTYQMIFSVFDRLSMNEKKELFMITNEKQTKVDNNLLRLLKKALNLLGPDEAVFDLIGQMNQEDFSPLKGRVMIGAESIKKGYKEGQLSKILVNSGVYEKLDRLTGGDQRIMCKVLSNYLKAWEQLYHVSFRVPEKDTLTKISGLRYILYLLPDVLDILGRQNQIVTVENCQAHLQLLPRVTETENVFGDPQLSLAFRGEGATVKLAKEHGNALYTYTQQTTGLFNPTAGL